MSVIIQYNRQTIELARQYARSHYSVEVCGVCFGCVWQTQEDGWLVSVEEFWPAPYANHSYASVSFTPQSWVAALDHLDDLRDQAPEHNWRIVGWYHSHPGFGIFFSGVDRHSHVTYFQQPWHVALVIDPRSGKEGWFGHSTQGEIQRFGLEAICEMPEQPPIPAPTLEAAPGTEEVST